MIQARAIPQEGEALAGFAEPFVFALCRLQAIDGEIVHAIYVFRQYAHRFAVSRVFHGLPGFLDTLESCSDIPAAGVHEEIDVLLRCAGDHQVRRYVVSEEILQHVRSVSDPVLFEPEMLVGVDERRLVYVPGQIGHEDLLCCVRLGL